MAWIESHQKLKEEAKLFDLMVAMDWSKAESIGRLHMLWWWCVDHCEDGDLRRFNNTHLALAVELNVQEGKRFVEALVSAGFIERQPYFRLKNWWKYVSRFMKQRYKDTSVKWKRIDQLYSVDPTGNSGTLDTVTGSDTGRITDTVTETVTVSVTDTVTQETEQTEQTEQTKKRKEVKPSHPPSDVQNFFDLWNQYVKNSPLSSVRELKAARRNKIKLRLRDRSMAEWEKVFQLCVKTPFLRGENDRGWKVGFDWVINKQTNAAKILEGNYENNGKGGLRSVSEKNIAEGRTAAGGVRPETGKYDNIDFGARLK